MKGRYKKEGGEDMAKVCPLEGCKEKEGMCIHDWMMITIMVVIVLVVALR